MKNINHVSETIQAALVNGGVATYDYEGFEKYRVAFNSGSDWVDLYHDGKHVLTLDTVDKAIDFYDCETQSDCRAINSALRFFEIFNKRIAWKRLAYSGVASIVKIKQGAVEQIYSELVKLVPETLDDPETTMFIIKTHVRYGGRRGYLYQTSQGETIQLNLNGYQKAAKDMAKRIAN